MIGVFGDLTLDVAVRSHGPLQIGSDVTGVISYRGGGSAANCAAWLGSFGCDVRFWCAVGQDLVGTNLVLELEEYGVEMWVTEKESPTGAILLFLDDTGERTMVTSRGANLQLRPEDLPEEFLVDLEHLHVTGYSLFGSEDLLKTTMTLLQKARQLGVQTSVDPSSYALLAEFGVERFLDITRGANLVFPNLDEGRVLTGSQDPDSIVKELQKWYDRVILTMGPQGCLCATNGELVRVATTEVEVVDTTGAGDAFAAGFLHALLSGADLVESAHFANKVASDCVQHYGGRPT